MCRPRKRLACPGALAMPADAPDAHAACPAPLKSGGFQSLHALDGQLEIEGVLFLPRSIAPTPGGPVLRLLRGDALSRLCRGEIYFSEVWPGHVKAWKRHRRQTQNFTVPGGRLFLAIHDTRPESPSRGKTLGVCLGRPDAWGILRIPPGLWYGFAAIGNAPALICNLADLPHDPAEGERLPPDDPSMPPCFRRIF